MAQTSWPFENIDTTEVQFSQWARHINEGIRPDFANELEPFADDSGLNVKVKSGQAMVRGHYYASTAEETLIITTPDAANPRIDSVVLELDIVANSILLKVVAGTPAASPVAPTLTQSEDGNVYQLLLANVDVNAGVFSIEAADVTDLRTYMFQGVGKWTTDTRPENPIDNQTIGYNTTLGYHEYFDGTDWQSLANLDPSPDEIITTQGDLIIGDASGNAVRLPVGSADQVLTSDGTTVSFQDAGGGGGLTLLSTTSLVGSKSVSVTGIDQSYTNLLVLVKEVLHENLALTRPRVRLNGTTTRALVVRSSGNIVNNFDGEITGAGSGLSPTNKTNVTAVIYDYTSSTLANAVFTANVNGDNFASNGSLHGFNTAIPITSITFDDVLTGSSGNFTAGTIEIYGVS